MDKSVVVVEHYGVAVASTTERFTALNVQHYCVGIMDRIDRCNGRTYQLFDLLPPSLVVMDTPQGLWGHVILH